MNHQPYENWIFSEEPLAPDQQQALEAHLESCAHCKHLSSAIHQVEKTFASSSTVLPSTGFSDRWHNRWVAREYSRQQTKMWLLTFGMFAVAGLVIAALVLLNLVNINWTYELTRVIAKRCWTVFKSFSFVYPFLIPMVTIFGVGTMSAVFVLLLTWLSSLYQLYRPLQESVIEK